MDLEFETALPGFRNIRSYIICGISHSQIHISGLSSNIRKPGFIADIYVNRRTQEVSIARIDTSDNKTLNAILSVVSRFQF